MEQYVFVCQECGEPVAGCMLHVRCRRCGRTHELFADKVKATSPPVHPITKGCELSPWMLPWERPTRPGNYEVKYHSGVVVKQWPGEWEGVVQSWRGAWK